MTYKIAEEDREFHWWGWIRRTCLYVRVGIKRKRCCRFWCKSAVILNFLWIHWHTGYPSDYFDLMHRNYEELGSYRRLRSTGIRICKKICSFKIPFVKYYSV